MNERLALYHLLLDRVQHMRERADPQQARFLDSAAASLRIEASGREFLVRWGENGSLAVPRHAFGFWQRGDSSLALVRRAGLESSRQRNAEAADAVIGHMLSAAGLEASVGDVAVAPVSRSAVLRDALLAMPAALAALAVAVVLGANTGTAVTAGFAALALLCVGLAFRDSHREQPLRFGEALVISVLAGSPAWFGASALPAAVLAIPLAALAICESYAPRAAAWAFPGALAALALWFDRSAGTVLLGALLLAAVLLWWPLSWRFPGGAVRVLTFGAAAAFAVWPFAHSPAPTPQLPAVAAWVLFACLLAATAGWWVHGRQLALTPLTALACFSAVVGAQLAADEVSAGIGGLAGFAAVTAYRVAQAFISSKA